MADRTASRSYSGPAVDSGPAVEAHGRELGEPQALTGSVALLVLRRICVDVMTVSSALDSPCREDGNPTAARLGIPLRLSAAGRVGETGAPELTCANLCRRVSASERPVASVETLSSSVDLTRLGQRIGRPGSRSERVPTMWDDCRGRAPRPVAPLRKEAPRRRSARALEHGGRLRAARALAARRLRGDPPGGDGRRAPARGRAGARVADLGAADGVNSYDLIRDLAKERAGRPDLRACPSPDQRVGGGRRPRAACLRWRCGRACGRLSLRRATPSGPPIRARAPITPRQRPTAMPAAERSSTTRLPHGDQHGGHPPPAGALPAGGHGAHRGHRDGHALDRRRGRPGLERLGLPGLPGPR